MALKPITFKIDALEVEALQKEANALRPPKPRSEYIRDIVSKRHEPKPRRPVRSDT